jgi:aerobic-type carbon monoxide dehydrogenase small subunit (CoxS/CutS family)
MMSAVGDAKITTLAGLGTPEKPHPIQTAYIEEQVPAMIYGARMQVSVPMEAWACLSSVDCWTHSALCSLR